MGVSGKGKGKGNLWVKRRILAF